MADFTSLAKNKSGFFVENSSACDKACERIFQLGQESHQGASEGLFAALKRNNETLALGFGQDNSSSLSFS